MKLVRVEARDIHLTLEIPLQSMKRLRSVLDMSEFKYDSSNKEEQAVYDFLMEELYPFVEGVLKGVEEETGA